MTAAGCIFVVQPNGSRWWRFKYRSEGRECLISFGAYPDVSLKSARQRRDDAHRTLAGSDPSMQRQAEKTARGHTFKAVAREWLALQETPPAHSKQTPLAAVTIAKARWLLDSFLVPEIGARPIGAVTAPELLSALRKIESRK